MDSKLHSEDGRSILTISDHNDYGRLSVVASKESMKRLMSYAIENYNSLSVDEQAKVLGGHYLFEKEGKEALRAYAASLSNEFFEGTGLPYMSEEVSKEGSVKRKVGVQKQDGYSVSDIDLPANNKIGSFFKSIGTKSMSLSMDFERSLKDEMSRAVDYDQKLKSLLNKKEIKPFVQSTISINDHVSDAREDLKSFSDWDQEKESLVDFLDRKEIMTSEPEKNKRQDLGFNS